MYRYQTDGKNVKLITSFDPSSQMGTNPVDVAIEFYAFTPDGKSLVFNAAEEVATGQAQVVDIINTDGTGLATLFTEPDTVFAGISVSPKGQIVFYNSNDNEVWEMNLDGTNAHALVNQPSVVAFYSPNMNTLYWSDASSTWTMNVKTGSSTEILPGYGVLGVAPTGAFILVTDGTNLYTFNPNGGGTPQKVFSAYWASM